jgi:hypothetical protein
MAANLTEAVFDRCDLYRAEFANAIASKADFRTSHNYTIDPKKTIIKKGDSPYSKPKDCCSNTKSGYQIRFSFPF